MEEVFVKNIKKEIDDCNGETLAESKSCLGLLDCGPIPYCNLQQDSLLLRTERSSVLQSANTKTEASDAQHVTIKDEPPEQCETETLVVKADFSKSKPKKSARSSELRLIRKDVIMAPKKSTSGAASATPISIDLASEKASQKRASQQKVSLKEKVSCVSSLAQQLHEVSSQKVAMPCPYCSYSTSSEGNLKKHVASHKESNMELYSCLLCPFTTIYKYQLKTHTDRHSLEFGKHLCRFCNFSTSDPEDLEQHLKSHETCELLVCKYCGYKSTHKASFNKHIRKHGRPCPVCNYITFDKADMERHCESHLTVGEAPQGSSDAKKNAADAAEENNIEFVCCGDDKKNFKLLSCKDTGCEAKDPAAMLQLAALRTKREGANLTVCAEKWAIGKKFTAKDRYLCMLCNYSCKYKFSLKQHMVTHTGVGKLPCPFCTHESGNRSNLRKHVAAKHPGQSLDTFSRHTRAALQGSGHKDKL